MKKLFRTTNLTHVVGVTAAMLLCSLGTFLWLNTLAMYLLALCSLAVLFEQKQILIKNPFLILCFVFFIAHLLHLLIDDHNLVLHYEIERKLAFGFLPFIWLNAARVLNEKWHTRIKNWYSIGITGIGIILMLFAFVRFSETESARHFFYHNLASEVDANAIYFSMLVLVAIIFSLTQNFDKKNATTATLLLLGTLLILLLSSKLYVSLAAIIFVFFILRKRLYLVGLIGVFILIIPLFFLGNEFGIKQRFKEIDLNKAVAVESEITQSTRFNGLSFRIELIKMGLEIVSESPKSLLYGVGPGNSQRILDERMEARNMYVGDPKRGDTGYKGYNFHNQYMQTLVETGILGLATLLSIFGYLMFIAIRSKEKTLLLLNAVFLIGFFTESYLSRQIGIVAFIGFNSLLLGQVNRVELTRKQKETNEYA